VPRDSVEKKIRFELDQIGKLLDKYDYLLTKANSDEEMDDIEVTALASVLHSFYNAVENIFLQISKNIDGNVPRGSNWHKDLLIQMSEDTRNREEIISRELQLKLLEYLAFRHFFRHSYSFYLDWDEMEELVVNMGQVKEEFEEEIEDFLEKK